MGRSMLALAAVGFSLASSAHVYAQATYNRWAPIVPNITWTDCDGTDGGTGYQCGFLDVPMDYANSSAGKATLALARYPNSVEPRLGTLFVNPGGPGGSGTDFVLGMGVALSSYTGGQYDILAWDPRGVGYTYPKIDCFNSTEDEAAFWQGTVPENGIEAKGNFTNTNQTDPDVVAFWAQEPEVDDLLGKVGQVCLGVNGDTLTFVGTAANVRDILTISDTVDGAGGLIHYWGFSYGTVIGNYLVNMFPDRVGRVIIDGVVNTEFYASSPPYEIWAYQIQDTEDVLAGFTAACAVAGPSGCPIAGTGSTSESIREWILELIDASYDYLKNGGTFGSAYVRGTIFQAMYHPTQWNDLASNLYQIADMLYTGNNTNTKRTPVLGYELPHPPTMWGIPKRDVESPRPFRDAMRKRGLVKRDSDESLYDYAFQAITCADAIDAGNTTTTDVFNEILFASTNSSTVFGPSFSIGGFYCHKWPARAVERYSGPWNASPKNPIIVIGNQADPITPLPGAEWVAETLGDGKNAFLVKQDDFGHCSIAEHSDCTLAIVAAFFGNGTYPTDDQVCPTNQQLFPTPSITKQSLDVGFVDPALNPAVDVPGLKSWSPSVNVADAGDNGGSTVTTTVITTATVTVTPTSTSTNGVDKATQDEIASLKSTRQSLQIALAALGGAFVLALAVVVFSALRGRQSRSYTPAGIPIVGSRNKSSKNKGIPIDLTDEGDEHDAAFLPPMKEGQSLKPSAYANDRPRASMETLKGYTDPYDPPTSALGSASLRPAAGGSSGPSSGRPASPNYRYAEAGHEYRDEP